MKIFFEQGHSYIAGASKPFFVPLAAIEAGAGALGFSNVKVVDRSPAMHLPFRPPTDDWNTLGLGTWANKSGELELPEQVRWIFDMTLQDDAPPFGPAQGKPDAPKAAHLGPPAWLIALLAVGGILGAGYAISRVA